MKRLGSILFFLMAMVIFSHAQTLKANWTNSSTGPAACSATVTTFCVLAQTLTNTTTNTVINAAISPTATSVSAPVNPTLWAFGITQTISLTVQYCGATACTASTALSTTPITAAVVNGVIEPPTNLIVTVQ